MNKKEKCSELMGKFFGPASAKTVQNMTDSDDVIVANCRKKVSALLGEDKAKEFDII